MKSLASMYALLLLVAATPGHAAVEPDTALLVQLAPSVVKIEAANVDGSVSIGSGVVIGPGLVATNCHVTNRAGEIMLLRGGARSRAESQYSDVEHDLCLLSAPALDGRPVPIAPVGAHTGQPVFAIGFAGGLSVRFTSGAVDAVYDFDGDRIIETSAWFSSGASGGGLFDDQGRLIGIISFMSRGPQTRHFCLPAAWAAAAAAKFRGAPISPLDGQPFWQQPSERQPYFLRAAALQSAGDWPALAALANEWSSRESGNAASWVALATAHAHLNQLRRSIAAYETAVAVDAGYARAWYELGEAYARNCESQAVAHVRSILASLDGRLADELARVERTCRFTPDAAPAG